MPRAAKVEVEEVVAKRKAAKRDDIPRATTKRLLSKHCGLPNPRTSDAAANEIVKAVHAFLKKAAVAASEDVKLRKTKTVNMDILKRVLINKCRGVSETDLMVTSDDTFELPKTGVVRAFKKELTSPFNVSVDGHIALVSACEAYIAHLSEAAGILARSAGRKTIQVNDVIGARKLAELNS